MLWQRAGWLAMVQSESFPTPPAGFTLPPCNAVGVEFIEGIHCSLELKSIEDDGNFFAGRDSGRAMNATETYDDEADYVKHSRRKAWTPWKNKIYKPYRLIRESQVVRRRGAIVHKKTQLLAECTQTLQMILSKLQGKELSEEQRAKYRAMAEKMHEKIATISSQTKKKKKMKKSASESYSKSSFAQTSMMWRWHLARQHEAWASRDWTHRN